MNWDRKLETGCAYCWARIISIINLINLHAFYSIEDIRYMNKGIFRSRRGGIMRTGLASIGILKKKK